MKIWLLTLALIIAIAIIFPWIGVSLYGKAEAVMEKQNAQIDQAIELLRGPTP